MFEVFDGSEVDELLRLKIEQGKLDHHNQIMEELSVTLEDYLRSRLLLPFRVENDIVTVVNDRKLRLFHHIQTNPISEIELTALELLQFFSTL